MRIVIDTNIWVSGLLWKGKAKQLLELAERGDIELCVANSMLLELEEVLSYERLKGRVSALGYTPTQLTSYALMLSTPIYVTITSLLPIVTNDPDDDIFLLCAVEAAADYVVTRDRHLLTLKTYHGISIVDLDTFIKRFMFEKIVKGK